MKILYLSDYFSTWDIGGATRVLSQQIQGLLKYSEIEMKLISGSPFKEDDLGFPIPWYRVTYKSIGYFPKLIGAIFKTRWGFKADIVHIHQPLIGFLAIFLLPRKIRRIYHFHSFWFDEKQSHSNGSLLYNSICQFKKLIENYTLKQMDHFVVLSEYSRDRLAKVVDTSNITIIPGSIDLEQYQMNFVLPDGSLPYRFLSLRRLDPRMGLDVLLKAISQFVSNNPNIKITLTIIGTGREEENLKALAQELHLEEHVQFLGRISEDELAKQLNSHDCMVIPTKSLEGFGMSVIESFAVGMPVLGTEIGGLKEFVRHELTFHSIPNCNVDNLEKGLKWCIEHFKPSKELKEECRKTVEQFYSTKQMTSKLLSLYKKSHD